MSVGGNQRGRSFFKQHGWDEIGSDKIEAKYTSRAAQLYRKQLEKDVVKAISDGAAGIESKPAVTVRATSTANSGVGSSAASASRMAAAGAKARLGNTRRVGGGGGGGGLGIKKVNNAVIDDSLFDQAPAEDVSEPASMAEAESMEEAVGGGGTAAPSSRFTMDALEEKRRPAMQRGKDGHLTLSASDDFFADPFGKTTKSGGAGGESLSPTGMSNIGIGGTRSGMAGGSRGRGAAAAPAAQPDSGAAQARFGNAKSISSSAFFDDDKKESDYEKQGRLSQFQGSTAISSDAYFGRQSSASRPGGSSGGDSLDASAAELVSKISLTARQDVQQLKAIATDAGTKLSRMAQSFMRDLQGGF